MRLILLGTGGCFPTPQRKAPAALVDCAGGQWLIDCGEDTWRSLAKAGYDGNEIDGILFTHYHLDHTGGLASLLFGLWAQKRRRKPFIIVGPPGLSRLARGLPATFGEWLDELEFALDWREVPPPATFRLHDELRVRSVEVVHSPKLTCVGYRLETEGKVLTVSGDTELCPGLIELAAGADALLAEAGTPDDLPRPGHVTPSALGEMAAAGGVRRIVLTHFAVPTQAELLRQATEKTFGGPVSAAADGDVFEI
ncbi:MAG TPA: ribonuclease Z [bacterium]|nr:ribonuclease Z [bacterium]